MKILWLYKYISGYDFDHHLHMSFAKFIGSYPGISLKAYGPGIQDSYPIISLMEYDARARLYDLNRLYKFDIVIVCTKSRCFDYYNPHEDRAEGCWLPSDFASYKCPKIVLEEDYHYEKNDKWYEEVKIDLILQRHYSQTLRENKVKMKFLPFSVDIGTFNTWKTECIDGDKILSLPYKRLKQFAFTGNYADKAYIYRKTASDILMAERMLVNFAGTKKVNGQYVKVLREYLGYVSCGSTYEICAAKNLEIMASGGVLFTNKFLGIDLLFPENSYCLYQNDGSDVVKQARKVLNEPEYVTEMVASARESVMNRHTHDIRLKELVTILKELR